MCYNPITLVNKKQTPRNNKHLNTIPCGKCIKCINKKRTEWAFRMHEESKDHSSAYLLTLTYDQEHLPYLNATTGQYPIRLTANTQELKETDNLEAIVYKKDLQDFIKNLRRQTEHLINKYGTNTTKQDQENYKIRYYFSSEYGTQCTKRPHYHGIIWNLQPPLARKLEHQKIWTKGSTNIKPIDNKIGTYYYLTKYLFKQRNYNIWTFKPFQLMSTKPFIGNRYLETSKEYHIAKKDLLTKFNNRNILIPRIYRDKLPHYLKELTNQKIFTILAKEEKKGLNSKKQNHHYDILKWFKQVTAENNEKQENLIFQNKFT